ncbi:MAG: restriction endonuclease [Methanobacterium sp.]|nr:restriction endonuclease [Methanobacterium sp.]
MEKKRLVDFVAKIMENNGFKVQKNYKTSKYLVDVYGVLPTVLGDIEVIVACKNYEERWKVGMDVLKEMEMVAKSLQASKVVVITTSEFSYNAISYAENRSIKLIDKDGLMRIAKKYSKKDMETGGSPYITDNDEDEDDGNEPYVLPSKSSGNSFSPRGKRVSLSGRRRGDISNKLKEWGKLFLTNTIGLIIIVLSLSTILTYLVAPNKALLGVLRILFAAVLSYGIVLAVERDLTATLIRGSTVFFVSLIIYIALIIFA